MWKCGHWSWGYNFPLFLALYHIFMMEILSYQCSMNNVSMERKLGLHLSRFFELHSLKKISEFKLGQQSSSANIKIHIPLWWIISLTITHDYAYALEFDQSKLLPGCRQLNQQKVWPKRITKIQVISKHTSKESQNYNLLSCLHTCYKMVAISDQIRKANLCITL